MIYSFVHRKLNYKRTEPVSQQRLRGDNYFSMMPPEALTHFWRRRLWRDNYVFSSVESIKLWQVPKENKDSKKKFMIALQLQFKILDHYKTVLCKKLNKKA